MRKLGWVGLGAIVLGAVMSGVTVEASADVHEPDLICVLDSTCQLEHGCNKCPNPPDYGLCCRRCHDGSQVTARCKDSIEGWCDMQTVIDGCGAGDIGQCSQWGPTAKCDIWNPLPGACGDRYFCFQ